MIVMFVLEVVRVMNIKYHLFSKIVLMFVGVIHMKTPVVFVIMTHQMMVRIKIVVVGLQVLLEKNIISSIKMVMVLLIVVMKIHHLKYYLVLLLIIVVYGLNVVGMMGVLKMLFVKLMNLIIVRVIIMMIVVFVLVEQP